MEMRCVKYVRVFTIKIGNTLLCPICTYPELYPATRDLEPGNRANPPQSGEFKPHLPQ